MGKRRNLNGTPGNLALSYLSSLGYYDGGYMADWLNFIARDKKIKEIEIDILYNKITPLEADSKPLKVHLKKLRGILKKELLNNGFETNFIKKAIMKFEIPIDNPRINDLVYCYPYIEDENEKVYRPKKKITQIAYEVNFNPIKIKTTTIKQIKNNWILKIKEIFK